MMGGLDGGRRLMSQQTLKPKNVGATLARFWRYFRRYWHVLLGALLLVLLSALTQIAVPAVIGQSVDCYLVPRPGYCWYANVPPDATLDAKLAGLLGIV